MKIAAYIIGALGLLQLAWGYIYAATPHSKAKDDFSAAIGVLPSGFLLLAVAAIFLFIGRRK